MDKRHPEAPDPLTIAGRDVTPGDTGATSAGPVAGAVSDGNTERDSDASARATVAGEKQEQPPVDAATANTLQLATKTAAGPGPFGATVGGYDILEKLGNGAMGVVYKARQRGLKRLVALKMISAGVHATDHERSRFRVEAEAAAMLQHANIIQIYEIGEHEGQPFLSLELVTGTSLAKKVGDVPQPPETAAQMVRTLALAMDHAHQHKIVHRDLKPANVLLNEDGTPKIADFGLAKSLEGESIQTQTGEILGTPSYMAPEQAAGKPKEVGPRADIYALGAILYHLLTGRPPFRGTSVWDTVSQVQTSEPVPPRQLQPRVPADLETICLKCLQKEPARRYGSAGELAEDLRRFQNGEPILARPISSAERLLRWARRNPRVAALSAAAALGLAGFVVTLLVAYFQIRAEQERTEQQRQFAEASEIIARNNEREARAQKASAENNAAIAKNNEQEARQQKDKAEKNAALARKQHADNVGRVLTLLVNLNNELSPKAGKVLTVDGLRKRFAELAKGTALEMARDLEGAGVTDYALVFSYQRLGYTLSLLGLHEEAHEQYLVAVDLTRKVLADRQDDKARFNLAFLLGDLGDTWLKAQGNASASVACFGEALAINTAVMANLAPQPATEEEKKRAEEAPKYQQKYVKGLVQSARLMWDPAATRKWLPLAVAYWQSRVKANPKDPVPRSQLAETQSTLGEACCWCGDWPASQQHHQAALELCTDLARDFPEDWTFPADLALVGAAYGDGYVHQGQEEDAGRLYRKHLAGAENSLALHPESQMVQLELAHCYERLGTFLTRHGEPARGSELLARSMELWEGLMKQKKQAGVADHVAMCLAWARGGKHKEARDRAELLLKAAPKQPLVLIETARCFALCMGGNPADKKALADRSVALLGQAVEQGYRNAAALEAEADWAGVREHGKFAEVLKKAKA